ncbi:hypothetical protein PS928_04417 [Pseudomonas fluorescens]|uniref:Uncharacterized protein n=1 Tax=Pseudomonas fluorescens TaxID=294 RepID=A0A5E7V1J3_PSEFL|nr:hypothetical protein PS928_04417 [Pseudomonas fluorescens]
MPNLPTFTMKVTRRIRMSNRALPFQEVRYV